MPSIEDLIGKSNNENSSSINMEGSFSCHTCNEVSYEAKYNREKGIITWQCSSKHVSSINFA